MQARRLHHKERINQLILTRFLSSAAMAATARRVSDAGSGTGAVGVLGMADCGGNGSGLAAR
ncbi:MAG: hypothetical protein ABSG68_19590, partial [Thermoguttaceae bacterium]